MEWNPWVRPCYTVLPSFELFLKKKKKKKEEPSLPKKDVRPCYLDTSSLTLQLPTSKVTKIYIF